jgi:hypothetical protein
MQRISRKAVAAVVAGLTVAGAGTAIAAGGSGSDTSFLDAVAAKLGISSEKLLDATKAVAIEQVDAQLEAGTITEAQADAMKERIRSGDVPFLVGPGMHRGGLGHGPGMGRPGGHLEDAAAYLGVTEAELVEQLRAGKSLADVAKAEGKSVDGLKQALLASEKEELDALVAAGTITQAQADAALARREERLDDMIAGTLPPRGAWGHHGGEGARTNGMPGVGHGSSEPAMHGGASFGVPA